MFTVISALVPPARLALTANPCASCSCPSSGLISHPPLIPHTLHHSLSCLFECLDKCLWIHSPLPNKLIIFSLLVAPRRTCCVLLQLFWQRAVELIHELAGSVESFCLWLSTSSLEQSFLPPNNGFLSCDCTAQPDRERVKINAGDAQRARPGRQQREDGNAGRGVVMAAPHRYLSRSRHRVRVRLHLTFHILLHFNCFCHYMLSIRC